MIRKATSVDLDQILRIERAAFSAPHWPWDAYEQMIEWGDDPGAGPIQRTVLVQVTGSEEDERVQGFAAGTCVYESTQLESIAVAESARRQGLGRALCHAFLDWSRELGADTVELEVRAGSLGAQSLYSSLGFEPVGLRPSYYANPVEDGVLMRCQLHPGSPAPHV